MTSVGPSSQKAALSVLSRMRKLADGNLANLDEKTAVAKFTKLRRVVAIQAWVLLALVTFFLSVLPFVQPVYIYLAVKPDQKIMRMVGLDMPNMTNRAILSWATTSITEIMTMGFGDIDIRLPKQRPRFTKDGWESYYKAFIAAKIGEKFKKGQLVLTTVPSNTPVITAQGINVDNVYQWSVQMPVIMTYATNNNATTREKGIVALQVVRVPAEESSMGIAIKKWDLLN